MKIYRLTEDDYLVVALGVNDENDIVCITKNGITIRTHVEGISRQGRNASGVKVVTMKSDDDEIVAVSDTTRAEDEEDNPDSVAEVEDTSKTDETDK